MFTDIITLLSGIKTIHLPIGKLAYTIYEEALLIILPAQYLFKAAEILHDTRL